VLCVVCIFVYEEQSDLDPRVQTKEKSKSLEFISKHHSVGGANKERLLIHVLVAVGARGVRFT